MRAWIWPVALSAVVVVACGAWEEDIQSQITGPNRSVDFRPLIPVVVGAVALAAVWLFAVVVWWFLLREYRHIEPNAVGLVDGERE